MNFYSWNFHLTFSDHSRQVVIKAFCFAFFFKLKKNKNHRYRSLCTGIVLVIGEQWVKCNSNPGGAIHVDQKIMSSQPNSVHHTFSAHTYIFGSYVTANEKLIFYPYDSHLRPLNVLPFFTSPSQHRTGVKWSKVSNATPSSLTMDSWTSV